MALPGVVTLCIPLLLKPSQPGPMSIQTADDIGNAVTIHVVNHDVTATTQEPLAGGGPKRNCMKFPRSFSARGRLLPPTTGLQNVEAPVAINVADAKTVRAPTSLFGKGIKHPGLGGGGG